MMINIIIKISILITLFRIIEIIINTKTFSKIKVHIITSRVNIETKSMLIMKKYKFIYRIIMEMLVIWFVFEWKESIIISNISKYYSLISNFFGSNFDRISQLFIFISPYGRKFIEDEFILKWLNVFTPSLMIAFVVFFFLTLSGTKNKLLIIAIDICILFIDWYLLLFISIFISHIPQSYFCVCWIVAILAFILVQFFMLVLWAIIDN